MIRAIRPEDAEAVRDICRSALGHSAQAEHIARRAEALGGNPQYYLAVCADEGSGRVVGFIQAERYDLLYGENGWNIIALAVAPDWQGCGAGRALLLSLEDHARSEGCAFVRLNSSTVREGAHAFYLHLGYTCDKTQLRFIRRLGAGG